MKYILYLWYGLLDLLFPPRCALCDRLLDEHETDFCDSCRKTAPDFPALPEKSHPDRKTKLQFLDSFTAVWYYKGKARDAVLRLKFHGRTDLAAPLGRRLSMALLRDHPEGFDCVTWVPVSTLRRLRRGYDQGQLLAKSVAAELGMEPCGLLKKVRNNRPQSSLGGEQRKGNVLGVYQFSGKMPIAGKRILLIDDVFTTGSTAEECARVLLTAGAKSVSCGTVAAAQKQPNETAG